MSKKRRTRAQKQKAASRRIFQKSKPAVPATEAAKTSAQKSISDTVYAQLKPRQRDLRISLVLLGSLLGLQVALWLVFHLTQIDEILYDWIKV